MRNLRTKPVDFGPLRNDKLTQASIKCQKHHVLLSNGAFGYLHVHTQPCKVHEIEDMSELMI